MRLLRPGLGFMGRLWKKLFFIKFWLEFMRSVGSRRNLR